MNKSTSMINDILINISTQHPNINSMESISIGLIISPKISKLQSSEQKLTQIKTQ